MLGRPLRGTLGGASLRPQAYREAETESRGGDGHAKGRPGPAADGTLKSWATLVPPGLNPKPDLFESRPKEIDPRDKATPDNWIPRDPSLIRLTGKHPLNCEPPLTTLMECGFITPPALHYVRNHGAVPRIKWEDHRITINGLLNKPLTLTMDELVKMPSRRIPVTLVCSGNRRKEQNMVKKGKGFNWGPAGASTSYWTGVRLSDILKLCGTKSAEEGARYVHVRGIRNELTHGASQGDGSYGTSIPFETASNPASDVLIAYAMNDEPLPPDHGYPVRLIVPGYIGGRMVKYLEEVTVAAEDTKNFMHYHDNRVFPSDVDQERAQAEGWWMNETTVIHELNINSVIMEPENGLQVPLDGSVPEVTFRGYAYTGGGRMVTRVEVTSDGGATWRQAEVHRFEKPTEYGRHWCWVQWTDKLPIGSLVRSREVAVRAWDNGMNTQPGISTWNLTGMMENSWYKLRVEAAIAGPSKPALSFLHPTLPGMAKGGWMDREASAAVADGKALEGKAAPAAAGLPTFTMAEVSKHKTREDVWFVYKGEVYNPTAFLKDHPGGASPILLNAGMDATEEFEAIHDDYAKKLLSKYKIGVLAKEGEAPGGPAAAEPAAAPGPALAGNGVPTDGKAAAEKGVSEPHLGDGLVFLDPKAKKHAPLIHRDRYLRPIMKSVVPSPSTNDSNGFSSLSRSIPYFAALSLKEDLTHNVRLFRFGFPAPLMRMGLPVGNHVQIYAKINNELVIRPYTPTTADEVRGYFDLAIKIYFRNQNPRYPEGGNMSQYLDSLAIGDEIEVRGPLGHFKYLGGGRYTCNGREGRCTRINMIAGGTGITPIFGVLKHALSDPSDPTEIRLLFSNVTPKDTMLKSELVALEERHPDRFHASYAVDKEVPETWPPEFIGRVSKDMLKAALFGPELESGSGTGAAPGMNGDDGDGQSGQSGQAGQSGQVQAIGHVHGDGGAGGGVLSLVCGPPPMVEKACVPLLKEMGFGIADIVVF